MLRVLTIGPWRLPTFQAKVWNNKAEKNGEPLKTMNDSRLAFSKDASFHMWLV